MPKGGSASEEGRRLLEANAKMLAFSQVTWANQKTKGTVRDAFFGGETFFLLSKVIGVSESKQACSVVTSVSPVKPCHRTCADKLAGDCNCISVVSGVAENT